MAKKHFGIFVSLTFQDKKVMGATEGPLWNNLVFTCGEVTAKKLFKHFLHF